MYNEDSNKEIIFHDVSNRIPPSVEGYNSLIKNVKVIEKGRDKLILLTLSGTHDGSEFELTKFLKFELRTGNVLYNLLKVRNKLPQKNKAVNLDELITTRVKIFVEDRTDNEGNIYSYVKSIEPLANQMPQPITVGKSSASSDSNNEEPKCSEVKEDTPDNIPNDSEVFETKNEAASKPSTTKIPNLKTPKPPISE